MNKVTERLKKLTENGGALRLVVIAGALGIALIFLSSFFSFEKPQTSEEKSFSVADYREGTQKDLESLLSKIQGAGKTRVLLTMDNSAEFVYLENGTTKTKEIEPRIRGVLVLCEGGGDPVTVARVTEAVTKALDISAAKVCIEKLSE